MKNKKLSVLDLIGNTPLVRIGNVYAKLESLNPSGSIKDRVALEIIEAAEREGKLKKGYTIVEASSGNTGISLSMVAAAKGYKMIVVMPRNMSEERKQMMRAFGAKLVLTSKAGSLKECIEKAEKIAKKPKTFTARQFSNPNNIRAQEKTGEEILKEIGPVDAVVAGVGTGGTLMGISNVMRKVNPKLKVIAIEPEEAAVMFGGSDVKISEHSIQGIGDGFIPQLIDKKRVDRTVIVGSEEAVEMARKLSKEYGLLVGISAGANMLVALKLAKMYDKIATVLPDRGERYLSMDLFKHKT
ncbi:MAG: pyridoxal-phosphate dependent enzyme [Candidatus Aenigmarchaeota archaeon]|nr:pyridoxal-phosphate dependent enzyme [Candidatus Aenigmarchaeota archaeon]